MAARYTDGNVSVTLDGTLEAFSKRMLDSVEHDLARKAQARAEKVATAARAAWYDEQGVKRVTGRSGDIQVLTTISDTEIKVSVGSTDTRTSEGKPVPALVRSARPTSTISVPVDDATYSRLMQDYRAGRSIPRQYEIKADKKGRPTGIYERKPNPRAASGGAMLQTTVKTPMKAQLNELSAEIRQTLIAAAKGR